MRSTNVDSCVSFEVRRVLQLDLSGFTYILTLWVEWRFGLFRSLQQVLGTEGTTSMVSIERGLSCWDWLTGCRFMSTLPQDIVAIVLENAIVCETFGSNL